ncbi:MAG TPA: hypothetical protein VLC10_02765, partial [Patescibacteria group bacterium]|nr:hypothetical protein [Patescibacteria group bacterium]
MNTRRIALVTAMASLLLVGAGCGKQAAPKTGAVNPEPPPREAPPAAGAVNAAPEVPQFAQCMLAADGTVTLYMRADAASDVFGTLGQGEAVVLGGKTDDGWYGFDPAAAQAPNVGPFRLRWIKPGSPVTVAGGCAALKVYPHVDPKACYVMTQTDTPVREAPAADAEVVTVMHYGDYAAAVGRTPDVRSAFWVKIDAGSGSLM